MGLLNPISVYRTGIVRNGKTVDGYGLIAGFHRLRACQNLGWESIPAVILDLDEQRRIIAECDENLCGSVLTPAERATFTAKRKDAYETLHPETRHGSPGVSRQVGDTRGRADGDRFTADTAAKTGQSERAVQRDAERGAKVCDEALALIRGTRLDTGVYLDQIKKLDPAAQVDRVTSDLMPKPQKPVDLSGVRRSKIDADVKDRAATAIAEWMVENADSEALDFLKANLFAAGANNIAAALTNLIGNSIMDKAEWK